MHCAAKAVSLTSISELPLYWHQLISMVTGMIFLGMASVIIKKTLIP